VVSIKIFIISPHLMFGSGLESLLRGETTLTVVGRAKNVEQAAPLLQVLQPDIVILDSDELTHNDVSSAVHIFNLNPHGRIIGLSLNHNKAYTYQINEVTLSGPDDLLQIINPEPAPYRSLSQDQAGTTPQELPL